MNLLVICSALDNSYLALEYENKIYSKIIKSDENYHSLYLISEIKSLFENNCIDKKNIDVIGVNAGPGSFTGIRVAMSIAKTMASELEIPLVGLNSAEILLAAFDKDVLVMDARRDMYFLGTKDEIKLVPKDKIKEQINTGSILCDSRCKEFFADSACFENQNINLGNTMLKLAKDKYLNSKDKNEFNYFNLKANYIQTPPIFGIS